MRQPNRIESITLRDIGVFEHTRFDFPPIESIDADNNKAEIHIFTGPNGCGKSTLLYALAGIFDMHGQYSLIRRRYRSDSSQVDFEFAGSSGKYGADVLNSNLSKTRLSGKPGHFFDYDGGWGSHLVRITRKKNSHHGNSTLPPLPTRETALHKAILRSHPYKRSPHPPLKTPFPLIKPCVQTCWRSG